MRAHACAHTHTRARTDAPWTGGGSDGGVHDRRAAVEVHQPQRVPDLVHGDAQQRQSSLVVGGDVMTRERLLVVEVNAHRA